jgi:hypothetical protein
MSESKHERSDELGSIFVSVTGDETITEEQDDDPNDRELEAENEVSDAVNDGLADAIAGAEADTGDPGRADG